METGSLETFNLRNVLRGLWEDKRTGRRVSWEQLVIKLVAAGDSNGEDVGTWLDDCTF